MQRKSSASGDSRAPLQPALCVEQGVGKSFCLHITSDPPPVRKEGKGLGGSAAACGELTVWGWGVGLWLSCVADGAAQEVLA